MARFQSLMHNGVTLIDLFNRKLGICVSWFAFAMMVLTGAVVGLRYAFNIGWIPLQELVVYLHGFLFMLAAAYTLQRDRHVRVDVFYRKFSPRQQAAVNLVGGVIFLLPFMAFITWVAWDYVAQAWQIREASSEAGGLPAVFVLKGAILLMTSTVFLQGLSESMKSVLTLLGAERYEPI